METYHGHDHEAAQASALSEHAWAGMETDGRPNGSAQASPQDLRDTKEDVLPEGGYGWVCVLCCFLINAHTWGINSSYGVFLAYYLSHDTFPGASALEYAFVGGLSISQALLISPIATSITRVYGTRSTLLLGVVLETVALVGASFARRLWHLLLTQGICFGWGMGFLFVASVAVVPQWFSRRRSLANGIVTGGSGIGGLIYSLASNSMIQHLGLAWAFRILAIIQFVVNLTCALLLRDRNKQIGTKNLAFDYRLLARPEFRLLLGWGFFVHLGYIVLLFSLPDYAVTIGLTAQQGSIIGALLNLAQGLGRPVVGYFSDAAGRINMASFLTFFSGLTCLVIWTFVKSYGLLIFFALLVGTVCGTYHTAVAPVGAEVLGLADLPSGLSIMWMVLVLPTTFAEPIALKLRSTTGNIYLHAQLFAGFMYIAAALCTWFLRAWKVGEMQTAITTEKRVASNGATAERGAFPAKSSMLRRLFAWQKV